MTCVVICCGVGYPTTVTCRVAWTLLAVRKLTRAVYLPNASAQSPGQAIQISFPEKDKDNDCTVR